LARCAFCRSEVGRLSAEHVLPAWLLREVLPAGTTARTKRHVSFSHLVKREHTEARREEGPVNASVVRKVCRDCNNGWMSSLEAEVKPIAASLARGIPLTLLTEGQRVLAFWALKTTIMLEYTHDATRSASSAERYSIYRGRNDRRLPKHAKVWIGWFDDGQVLSCSYFHRASTVVPPDEPWRRPPRRPNVQATVFLLGHLLLVVFSGTMTGADELFFPLYPFENFLHCLTPPHTPVRWPNTARPVTDFGAVAQLHENLLYLQMSRPS
jgi:hypothetical protein